MREPNWRDSSPFSGFFYTRTESCSQTESALVRQQAMQAISRGIHLYELYLELNDIEHRRTQVRCPQSNGFVERFQRMVLDEFFCQAFRTTFYESVQALQPDLDTWLVYYNTQRPHQGKRPIERLEQYVQEHSQPVFRPPATPEEQPGAQPQSRGFSEAALDGGEHRATMAQAAAGMAVVLRWVRCESREKKSSSAVRNDD